MKMSKFRVAVLVLLVATILYAVALCQDVLARLGDEEGE